MATVFAPLWYCGARDTAGAAIATGKAYFYVVGSTSNFITIYADALENEPITHDATHPVTLDAGGRAKVFLKTPAKVVITDADDVVKQTITEGTSTHLGLVAGTWNGATNPTQDALTAIEASLGENAKYLLKSGATARLYHDVVAQFVTPKDYAAVGDGVADDTTPLQNAIDAAISLGIPLNLEKATYKITAGLTAAGIINIYGAGMSESIITTTATGITGLTIAAASGSYLRDFAVHLPYDGTTYDQALLIGGSTCTVERLDVTGGEGIKSTAPHTRVVDCVVNFKCPNTAGAYGSGIYLTINSQAINCSVNGQVGNSATYLTRGIYMPAQSAETTCSATDCRIYNCYRGAQGGLLVGGEVDTCTTGVYCDGAHQGAAFTRFTSCTTPFNGSGGMYPINVENHFDGTLQTYRSDCSYQEDATDAPTFTISPGYKTFIFKLTYSGTVASCVIGVTGGAASWKIGDIIRVCIQTSAATDITDVVWDTDPLMVTLGSEPAYATSTYVIAEFLVTATCFIQVAAWTYGTAIYF
jgi:hypothetical protein